MLPEYVKDMIEIEFESVVTNSYISNNTINIQISEASENYNQNYIAYDTYAFQSEITKVFSYYMTNESGTKKLIDNHLIRDAYGNNTIPYNYIKNLTANFYNYGTAAQSMDFVFTNRGSLQSTNYALTSSGGTTDQLVIDNSILDLDFLSITTNSTQTRGGVLFTYV